MSPPSSSQGIIRFGDFDADLHSGELRKHGLRIKLQIQPFQVLQILLEHAGKVVTREELQKRIWPADTFVDFDHGLNNAVKKLREALADDAEKPHFIETLSKRGYRFIGSINTNQVYTPTVESLSPEPARFQRKILIGTVAALGISALLYTPLTRRLGTTLGSQGSAAITAPQIRSLAVLPLQNLSDGPAKESLSDGLTDALITNLAQISSIAVISRTSTMQYNRTRKSIPEIARELGADGIVEGTVQRSGNHVHVTVQLVLGRSDKHLWANTYDQEVHDIFTSEQDLTEDIAHQIQAQLTVPLVRGHRVSPEVLDAYLDGSYHLHRWGKGDGNEEIRKAVQYFQQAVDAIPEFVQSPRGYGYGDARSELLRPLNQNTASSKIIEERTLALDSDLSEALVLIGNMKEFDWDFREAEAKYRQATALDSNNADAHEALGRLLDEVGRLDEGLKERQIAQQLDPSQDRLSEALMIRGQYDQAIALVQTLLKRHPRDGYLHWTLFRDYAQEGKYADAILHLEQSLILYGDLQTAAHVHHAFVASGNREAIREAAKSFERSLEKNEKSMSGTIAELYATIGDKSRVFYWLEWEYAHPDIESFSKGVGLQSLNTDFQFDFVRSDPRFKDLVRRVGLPDVLIETSKNQRRTAVLAQQ